MTANGAYGAWDSIEERYVGEVGRELHDVPRRQRRELVAIVAADLAERPDSESWPHLVDEVGEPAACAATLRADHGLPPHVGIGGHLRAIRWSTWAVVAVVVVGAVAGGAAVAAHARWADADPMLINSCSGVPNDGPYTTDPRVRVEDKEAAGARETVIDYVDGANVSLALCLSAEPGTELVDIRLPGGDTSTFQQTQILTAPATADLDGPFPVLDGPTPVNGHAGLRVVVDGRLTNCEWSSPGGGMGIDTADVTYRYHGRTRTVPVSLTTQYTFFVPTKEDCPRTRPDG